MRDATILWIDFIANAEYLASKENQRMFMKNAKEAGVTRLVIDAKIPFGQVTYPSEIAPHVSTVKDGRYKDWQNRDFLKEMITLGQNEGFIVLVNFDVFAEGEKAAGEGMAYTRKDWQVTYYFYNQEIQKGEFIPAEESEEYAVWVNPILPEVQKYQLAILKEVVANYELDGVVLDRCRYPNVYGDFSSYSKNRFEDFVGEKLNRWPEDVLSFSSDGEVVRGCYFNRWIEWRAGNITEYVKKAKAVVKNQNPNLLFSIYVGSWHPLYYNEGVNWGSRTFQPDYDWTSETYHVTGYGDELDFIMTGCYYPDVTKQEAITNGKPADWYSVEGGIEVSKTALNGHTPVIASLYLQDYKSNPNQFFKAIAMCKEKSEGVMLFDTSHLNTYKWWDVVKKHNIKQ
ncbi:MAG: alpha amylase family protein [Bacillota bacterium]